MAVVQGSLADYPLDKRCPDTVILNLAVQFEREERDPL